MARINVLVAASPPDVKAEVIAESVAARSDMTLVEGRCLALDDVDKVLKRTPASIPCAVVVVGAPAEMNELAERWLLQRSDLVVMLVDVLDDVVRIAVRDPRLDSLLTSLRGLVERVGAQGQERVARIQLRLASSLEADLSGSSSRPARRPLLEAAVDWVRERLRGAIERVSDENGDVLGLSVTRATLLQLLERPFECDPVRPSLDSTDVDEALERARAAADPQAEPLAALAEWGCLSPLEFRMLLLGLAPELDLRFQRCLGFLLDDMSRRVGTLGLYSLLLGPSVDVRGELAGSGALARWAVFEVASGHPVGADEPLRVDAFLVRWLLGEADAFDDDPRIRRALQLVPWAGAGLLQRHEDRATAASLLGKLQGSDAERWLLLGGDDPAGWRALLELGAEAQSVVPIRVDPTPLVGTDILDVEDSARRLARLARLTRGALVIDVTRVEGSEAEDDALRLFLAAFESTRCRGAVICKDAARVVRLLGKAEFELVDGVPFSTEARVAALQAAADQADAHPSDEVAEAMLKRYPLRLDGLEHAMRLACSRPKDCSADDPALARFSAACREVAAEGLSQLATPIEPVFRLDDVVLPLDRQQQLTEVVDNVRLADRVLTGWRFGDRLPYGRGVAALFHGASGTGKTMAAMGIARRLGIRLLRLDLSRVVSKYIGDTEKNIDRVFSDAQRSGAAILIDEAEALLGKRSEVKDAHDRYANIEVAYLLQRMEAYEGLAILTTNLRQNLDPAFLRRLRFIVDFPRPDVEAREKIWRQCLPDGSHVLNDAAFRQLARRVDFTGGHICQVAVRAAFLAAAAGLQIGLEHVAHALQAELAKLGMPPVELDLSQTKRAA